MSRSSSFLQNLPSSVLVLLLALLSSGSEQLLASGASTSRVGDLYNVGVGIGDVTGPSAGIGMVNALNTYFHRYS